MLLIERKLVDLTLNLVKHGEIARVFDIAIGGIEVNFAHDRRNIVISDDDVALVIDAGSQR